MNAQDTGIEFHFGESLARRWLVEAFEGNTASAIRTFRDAEGASEYAHEKMRNGATSVNVWQAAYSLDRTPSRI